MQVKKWKLFLNFLLTKLLNLLFFFSSSLSLVVVFTFLYAIFQITKKPLCCHPILAARLTLLLLINLTLQKTLWTLFQRYIDFSTIPTLHICIHYFLSIKVGKLSFEGFFQLERTNKTENFFRTLLWIRTQTYAQLSQVFPSWITQPWLCTYFLAENLIMFLHFTLLCCPLQIFKFLTELSSRGGSAGWSIAHLGFADQLTLSQLEGADCAPSTLHAHPALGSFIRPWTLNIFLMSY